MSDGSYIELSQCVTFVDELKSGKVAELLKEIDPSTLLNTVIRGKTLKVVNGVTVEKNFSLTNSKS